MRFRRVDIGRFTRDYSTYVRTHVEARATSYSKTFYFTLASPEFAYRLIEIAEVDYTGVS